jgi:hypothetical protein
MFHHLEETGSEVKITAFQEKNSQLKSSMLTFWLALLVEGAGKCSLTSNLQDHFRELTYKKQADPDGLCTQEEHGFKQSEWIPKAPFDQDREAPSIPTQPSISTLRDSTKTRKCRESHTALIELRGNPFLSLTRKKLNV